jgi:pentatricopeptide repeat protein
MIKNLFLLSLLIVTFSFGEDVQPNQKQFFQAKKLFSTKQYQKAYDSFYILFENNLQDPNINFYLGRSAFMLQKYELAIAAYERVLLIDEDSIRSELEIARCYFELQNYDEAKKLFNEILNKDIPSNVKNNINVYLTAIEKKVNKHIFNSSLILGLNYDTNIYQRSSDDTFTIPGLIDYTTNQPLEVTNTTEDASGTAHQEILLFNHLYNLDESKNIKNDFVFFSKSFFQYHDKDIMMFQYSPALSVMHNSNLLADYALLYNKVFLEKKPLFENIGIYPKFQYVYSEKIHLGGGLKYLEKKHTNGSDKNKDLETALIESSVNYIYSDDIVLNGYAQLSKEKKKRGDLTNLDNEMIKFGFSMQYQYLPTLSITPKIQWLSKKYKENDPFYLKKQQDDEYQFSLNALYAYANDILWNLSYVYTDHSSNIPSSKFDKQSFTGNVIFLF